MQVRLVRLAAVMVPVVGEAASAAAFCCRLTSPPALSCRLPVGRAVKEARSIARSGGDDGDVDALERNPVKAALGIAR